jgi:hypothetical protein
MTTDQEPVDGKPPYFDSVDHALHMGLLVGTMMRAGVPVQVITDEEGNYTPDMEITIHDVEDVSATTTIHVRVTG